MLLNDTVRQVQPQEETQGRPRKMKFVTLESLTWEALPAAQAVPHGQQQGGLEAKWQGSGRA